MPQPLTETDILFPHLSNTPRLSSTLSSLRRSTLSIHNRLSSIVSDSTFVASVAQAYALPLVANERCGSWYIPPSCKTDSVYFKSTDGHMGEWKFSLRRLNLQLLDVVERWGGAVIVDSTRRGKSMPDALSKTVPIWCCVVNQAVFGVKHELFTPPQTVSQSEHAQIERRIEGLVRQFLDICKPNISYLRARLQRPLHPIWVTQQSTLPASPASFPDFHPIVLCTASRRVHGAEVSENGYIQGAADDHEAWAQGLTPMLFWKHKDLLINTNEEDAPGLIRSLMSEEKGNTAVATLIKPSSNLWISPSENINLTSYDVVISCTPNPLPPASLKGGKVQHYLHFKCQTGKLGSRDLRTQLPQIQEFFTSLPIVDSSRILICCPTGKDLSVGTALAILCLYVNEEGALNVSKRRKAKDIGKSLIKQRLSWITTSNPALNPSRATLQSVNAVLLESQDPKLLMQTHDDGANVLQPHTSLPTRPKQSVTQESDQVNDKDHDDDIPNNHSQTIFHLLATRSPTHRPWTFTRTLHSALPSHPSGTVTGTATFTPCASPLPPFISSLPTLLYAEEGDFVTDTGLRFSARRKYVYQLKGGRKTKGNSKEKGEVEGTHIAVHFFDDEKMPRSGVEDGVGKMGEGVGGLFVEMGKLFTSSSSSSSSGNEKVEEVFEAKNREQHLCAEDLYIASWKFSEAMSKGMNGDGEGVEEELWWEVRYDVKGPKKEYVSRTRYTR